MKNFKIYGYNIIFIFALYANLQAQQVSNFEQPQQSFQYSQPSNGKAINSPSVQTSALKIGIVNTKRCLEESKLGKQEQANFEKMKTQMESVLRDKETQLEEIETKLNDEDYLDGISEEAEGELKRKKRTIRNEGMQLQNQYMQTLQQANVKIVQKLTDSISKASADVAKDPAMSLDAIFSDDAATFYAPHLDVSTQIISKMNTLFDEEKQAK